MKSFHFVTICDGHHAANHERALSPVSILQDQSMKYNVGIWESSLKEPNLGGSMLFCYLFPFVHSYAWDSDVMGSIAAATSAP